MKIVNWNYFKVKEFLKKNINQLWNLDIILVVLMISIMFLFSTFQSLPKVDSSVNLFLIPLIFLSSILISMVLFHKIKTKSKLIESIDVGPQNLTYKFLLWIVISASLAIFISWGFCIVENVAMLKTSPIFGLRAITTSLHKLVPLESRIQFVLIPLVLLYPAIHRKIFLERLIILFFLIITFATLTKLGFIFATFVLFYILIIKDNKFKILNRLRLAATLIFIFSMPIAGLKLINLDINNAYHLNKEHDLKINNTEYNRNGISATSVCAGETEQNPSNNVAINSEEMSTYGVIVKRLMIRTFDTPSRMIRLFICLREQGWRPNFRGHQLFRLVKLYIPYYRMAYEAYRPGEGNIISSAVTNVAADAYFNSGHLGVALSGFCLSLIWFVLSFFTKFKSYWGIIIFIKIYLAEVILQLSLLSVIVTVAPIISVLIFDLILTYFTKRKNNVL